jgi:hypothetical protein
MPPDRLDCDRIVEPAYREACDRNRTDQWFRASISLNDMGEWVETREWQRREGTVTSWVEYFKVVLRKQRAPQLRSPVPESRPPQAAGVRHDTDTGPLLID